MAPLQLPTEPRPPRAHFPAVSRSPRDTILQSERPPLPTELHREPRRVRLALAGCGVVGGGLIRLLHETAPSIASRFGVTFDITAVLVRDVARQRNLPIDPVRFTDDLAHFLSCEADVVVEAVGGDEPARAIASHALTTGRKFITANKDLIAVHGAALATLAAERRVGLDFGAAVGGSVPVISTLRDVLGGSTPTSVRAILNGTSNYVLSEIERGVSFDAALGAARSKGLAESDCSKDLDGRDAAAKLRIIAWTAFGVQPHELDVRRISLPEDPTRLVQCASRVGGRLRLIGECVQLSVNTISASVEPTIVARDTGFGRTHLEENRVEIDLGLDAPVSVSGAGAGGEPTATALLADLVGAPHAHNERRAETSFVSVPDERGHRWFVSALIPFDGLQTVAAEAEIAVERTIPGGSFSAVVTDAVPWQRVQKLLAVLDGVGAEPNIARYELSVANEEARR